MEKHHQTGLTLIDSRGIAQRFCVSQAHACTLRSLSRFPEPAFRLPGERGKYAWVLPAVELYFQLYAMEVADQGNDALFDKAAKADLERRCTEAATKFQQKILCEFREGARGENPKHGRQDALSASSDG